MLDRICLICKTESNNLLSVLAQVLHCNNVPLSFSCENNISFIVVADNDNHSTPPNGPGDRPMETVKKVMFIFLL